MTAEVGRCADCGARLPPRAATGRPRRRCITCAADRYAIGRAWRDAHPERVLAYRLKARAKQLGTRRRTRSLASDARDRAKLAKVRRKLGEVIEIMQLEEEAR